MLLSIQLNHLLFSLIPVLPYMLGGMIAMAAGVALFVTSPGAWATDAEPIESDEHLFKELGFEHSEPYTEVDQKGTFLFVLLFGSAALAFSFWLFVQALATLKTIG